ncbi:MAG: sigma-54-dependent Fis family transcriptional regulator [Nitrospirae bacterium]|nr:sigma-54-dependent Fis family transcriptional regulator [Nitrospirota bacterium]
MPTATVLIVEDDARMRRVLELVLKGEGYDLLLAGSGEEGVQALQHHPTLRRLYLDVPVVILAGSNSVATAVEAMKKGAYDYIVKPVDNDELKLTLARALQARRLTQDNKTLRASLDDHFGFDRLVSRSPQMAKVKRLAQDIAQTDATVLITGESGTGKEVLARAMHYASPRASGPLVALNCAGIPESLLESELFGYEKGAFTDAKQAKKGRFQLADHGTLFLDEIGEMSLPAQAKFLRVLEDRMVDPLGGVRGVKVDIRVIGATNQDLRALIAQGRFRKDLYYRLHVCPLHLPPLRERTGDVRELLDYFLETACRERGARISQLSPEALEILERYHWPGNIRELHNIVELLTITCREDVIMPSHLPPHLRTAEPHEGSTNHALPKISLLSLGLSVEDVEKEMLREALQKSSGNVSEASRLLKITRNTLRYRMAKYEMTEPLHGHGTSAAQRKPRVGPQ